MRDHSKLRAFQLADQLVISVYEQTRSFPREELFGLTSQLRRAAVSVASNIVEGSARLSKADYIRMLLIAFGSCKEVEYQLSLAQRLSFLNPERYQEVGSLAKETGKVLSGLIHALRRPNHRPDILNLQPSRLPS
ncbi:MAG: four helix bundle protein [Acidobacteriota bacterium]